MSSSSRSVWSARVAASADASAFRPATTVHALRRQFPGLDGPAVRLDGPAAAQTHQSVLAAMAAYLRTSQSNLGGAYAHTEAEVDRLLQAIDKL